MLDLSITTEAHHTAPSTSNEVLQELPGPEVMAYITSNYDNHSITSTTGMKRKLREHRQQTIRLKLNGSRILIFFSASLLLFLCVLIRCLLCYYLNLNLIRLLVVNSIIKLLTLIVILHSGRFRKFHHLVFE